MPILLHIKTYLCSFRRKWKKKKKKTEMNIEHWLSSHLNISITIHNGINGSDYSIFKCARLKPFLQIPKFMIFELNSYSILFNILIGFGCSWNRNYQVCVFFKFSNINRRIPDSKYIHSEDFVCKNRELKLLIFFLIIFTFEIVYIGFEF